MSEQAHGTGEYILHHLTNLKLDLHTMKISTEATGFWVLNLDSVVMSIVLGLIFMVAFRLAAAKATSGAPGKWQNFIELCVEFVDGQVKDGFHHKSKIVAPMALTVFFWVLLMNFMDMLPIDIMPMITGAVGLEHFKSVPSTDPNITIGMSLTVFLIAFGYSFVMKGFKGVSAEFLFHPFGKWMMPVNFLLKCVEELAKPLSLGLRLFGNMYAGEMIFILLACFTLGFGAPEAATMTNLGALIVATGLMSLTVFLFARGKPLFALLLLFGVPLAGAVGWIPGVGSAAYAQMALTTAWTIFHILIIALQAFIFMTLTVVYMAMSADHH